MDDWKLQILETKLATLGITRLVGGEYLDKGTGEIIKEGGLELLYGDSGIPCQTGRMELTISINDAKKKCYICGSGIAFKKLDNGKYVPINEDGTSHKCRK